MERYQDCTSPGEYDWPEPWVGPNILPQSDVSGVLPSARQNTTNTLPGLNSIYPNQEAKSLFPLSQTGIFSLDCLDPRVIPSQTSWGSDALLLPDLPDETIWDANILPILPQQRESPSIYRSRNVTLDSTTSQQSRDNAATPRCQSMSVPAAPSHDSPQSQQASDISNHDKSPPTTLVKSSSGYSLTSSDNKKQCTCRCCGLRYRSRKELYRHKSKDCRVITSTGTSARTGDGMTPAAYKLPELLERCKQINSWPALQPRPRPPREIHPQQDDVELHSV